MARSTPSDNLLQVSLQQHYVQHKEKSLIHFFLSFNMIYFHVENMKIFSLQYSDSTWNTIDIAMPLNREENTNFIEQCEYILSKVKLNQYIWGKFNSNPIWTWCFTEMRSSIIACVSSWGNVLFKLFLISSDSLGKCNFRKKDIYCFQLVSAIYNF